MGKRGVLVFLIASLLALTVVFAAGSAFKTRADLDTRPHISIIGRVTQPLQSDCADFERLNTCLRECVPDGGRCVRDGDERSGCFSCDMSSPGENSLRDSVSDANCDELAQVMGALTQRSLTLFDSKDACEESDCSGSCIDRKLVQLYAGDRERLQALGVSRRECFVCQSSLLPSVDRESVSAPPVIEERPAADFRDDEKKDDDKGQDIDANIPGPLHPGDFSCDARSSNLFDAKSRCANVCDGACELTVFDSWVSPGGHKINFAPGVKKNCWSCDPEGRGDEDKKEDVKGIAETCSPKAGKMCSEGEGCGKYNCAGECVFTVCSKDEFCNQGECEKRCDSKQGTPCDAADGCGGVYDCDGKCTRPKCSGGQVCRGKSCITPCSPVNGGWSSWVNSGGCVSGRQLQKRSCNNPSPSCGGSFCSGPSSRSISCCQPVDGGWSSWVNSGGCTNGRQLQKRACNNPSPSCGGSFCSGSSSRSISCCQPVDGGWSSWVNSGGCVRGQQKQVRFCNNPRNSCGGRYCSGQSSRYISCGYQIIPNYPTPQTPAPATPPPTTYYPTGGIKRCGYNVPGSSSYYTACPGIDQCVGKFGAGRPGCCVDNQAWVNNPNAPCKNY